MRVSKWWKNLHFWVKYAFKSCIFFGNALHNSVRHLQDIFSCEILFPKTSSSSIHPDQKKPTHLYNWYVTYHCLHLRKHQFSLSCYNPQTLQSLSGSGAGGRLWRAELLDLRTAEGQAKVLTRIDLSLCLTRHCRESVTDAKRGS